MRKSRQTALLATALMTVVGVLLALSGLALLVLRRRYRV